MSESADGRTRSDRVLDVTYSKGLEALSIDELRARRKEAEKEEQELSYVRRLLHGRIDIIKAEVRRRSGEDEGQDIIANLSTILADTPSSGRPGQGRYHSIEGPGDDAAGPEAELALAEPSMVNIASMDDDQLQDAIKGLQAHERQVSEGRNQVHQVIDRLSGELTRRYREGSADVNDLLSAARKP